VEEQVARHLEVGSYCSLRTTVKGRRSAQDIALFIYRNPAADLLGSGLVVVSLNSTGELARRFADVWFEQSDLFMKERFSPAGKQSPPLSLKIG
jgi:hypothetical protein